jgi:hypothetical protein
MEFNLLEVNILSDSRKRFLSVRLSQQEWCQLDSLLIALDVPMYNPEKNRNFSQSERFRILLDILAPEVEHWHWLNWSRLTLDESGGLKIARRYPYSKNEDMTP